MRKYTSGTKVRIVSGYSKGRVGTIYCWKEPAYYLVDVVNQYGVSSRSMIHMSLLRRINKERSCYRPKQRRYTNGTKVQVISGYRKGWTGTIIARLLGQPAPNHYDVYFGAILGSWSIESDRLRRINKKR